jgi:prolyl 4-hydroxylase
MRANIPTQILSKEPFIAILDSGFDDDTLDAITKLPFIEKTNTNRPERKGEETRISHTFYTHRTKDFLFITQRIINRLKDEFMHTYSMENADAIQFVQYSEGGFFKNHTDFMNQDSDPLKKITPRDRVATAIIYCNDNYLGGNTSFPELNISVVPKKGQMLYYEYNYKKTPLTVNMKTMHSGDTVSKGEKIIGVQLFLEEK